MVVVGSASSYRNKSHFSSTDFSFGVFGRLWCDSIKPSYLISKSPF